jgi:hypothetical protein
MEARVRRVEEATTGAPVDRTGPPGKRWFLQDSASGRLMSPRRRATTTPKRNAENAARTRQISRTATSRMALPIVKRRVREFD